MRDSGHLLHMAHEAMVKAGINVNAIYMRLGYDTEKMRVEVRTPHEMQAMFWEIVEGVSGDPDVGLHICPHLQPFRGEVLEYLMFSAPTVRDGLLRATKYLRIISDALDAHLIEDQKGTRIVLKASTVKAPQLRHTEICIAYGLTQFLMMFTENRVPPLRVLLRVSRRSPVKDYEKIFGCPVEFEGEASEIWLSPETLAYRSPRWDPDLLKLHEELAQKRLSNIERQDLIERIQRVFSQRLELEQCSLEDVARELGIAPRRLRFELMRAGTSFSKLLNDFRYTLARRLLRGTSEPIENIVYLTGFSEPSTFYRAFKRWSGLTPVQYREQSREQAQSPPRGKR